MLSAKKGRDREAQAGEPARQGDLGRHHHGKERRRGRHVRQDGAQRGTRQTLPCHGGRETAKGGGDRRAAGRQGVADPLPSALPGRREITGGGLSADRQDASDQAAFRDHRQPDPGRQALRRQGRSGLHRARPALLYHQADPSRDRRVARDTRLRFRTRCFGSCAGSPH